MALREPPTRAKTPKPIAERQNVFDIYTIIFLALAVFIFFRLRSVLGQRTGNEPRYDRAPEAARPPASDNVVPLPTRPTDPAAPIAADAADPPVNRWQGIAAAGSPVAAGLDAIAAQDTSFDGKHFIEGARSAYEMVVTAFAEGDRRSLKNMLAKEVYDGFDAAIRDREVKGETVETKFVGIDKAEVTAAEMRGRTAHLTLRFVSQLISATKDRAGVVIDGSPEKVTDVTDVWTFARDLSSRDPNWKLVATEAGA